MRVPARLAVQSQRQQLRLVDTLSQAIRSQVGTTHHKKRFLIRAVHDLKNEEVLTEAILRVQDGEAEEHPIERFLAGSERQSGIRGEMLTQALVNLYQNRFRQLP
jgi:hypothetical protein